MRISILRGLILVIYLGSFSNLVMAQKDPLTTFILVRHAEKASDGTSNPGLTENGKNRAKRLAQLFANTSFSAIYSSPYQRTVNTALPLATRLNMEIQEYNPGSKNYLNEISSKNIGGTVLISGHSNTVPPAVNQLIGEQKFDQLQEDEYDKIFIVTISDLGKGTVTVLTY